MVEMILVGVALAVIVGGFLALVGYAARGNEHAKRRYKEGQLETLNDPRVVDTRHVHEQNRQNIAAEENTNTENSLIQDRTPLNSDE